MKINNNIIGIIYPILQSNFSYLLKHKEPVYIKYITHTKSKNPTKLQKGHYLLFYVSKKDKSISGYSKIKNVSFKQANEIKNQFIHRIQLNSQEFSVYIQNRESKYLLFLELEEIIQLKKPVIVTSPISMAGQYISKNQLNAILEKKHLSE